MTKLYFSTDHEYIRVDGGEAVLGISDYAQSQLGDIVFVDLPEVGAKFAKGDEIAVIESVKAASEIYAPVDIEIVAINEELEGTPDLVNSAPMDGGWLAKVKIADGTSFDDLMDDAAYQAHIA